MAKRKLKKLKKETPAPRTTQEIRDAGLMIDVPFEVPDPGGKALTYSADGGAEKWVPPKDFKMGGTAWDDLPEIDPEIAAKFGTKSKGAKPE